MAKKKKIPEIEEIHQHRDCKHCKLVTDRFLDYKQEPLMGRCSFYEHLFLLNEKTNCKSYV